MTSYYNNNNSLVKYGIKGKLISKFYIEYVKQEEFIKFNHNDEYDLLTNKFKYEIKTDSNYFKYKSIFLEFESNNKPSGIKTSKSDLYIFVCPNNKDFEIIKIFEIETINLKKIILELELNKILLIKNSPCKDYYNNIYSSNKGYIIPKLFLIKYGLEYDININDFEQLKNIL
jgi:hypothetical protein